MLRGGGAPHQPPALGTLYRRTGKRDQAMEHFTIATTRYREMDMQFWLMQGTPAVVLFVTTNLARIP